MGSYALRKGKERLGADLEYLTQGDVGRAGQRAWKLRHRAGSTGMAQSQVGMHTTLHTPALTLTHEHTHTHIRACK